MKNIQNSQRVVLNTFISYEPTKDELLKQFAKNTLQTEINRSVLVSGNSIIAIRGSKLGTKRGKEEYKLSLNNKNHSIERNAMIHQIVQYNNPKMNLKVIILN